MNAAWYDLSTASSESDALVTKIWENKETLKTAGAGAVIGAATAAAAGAGAACAGGACAGGAAAAAHAAGVGFFLKAFVRQHRSVVARFLAQNSLIQPVNCSADKLMFI